MFCDVADSPLDELLVGFAIEVASSSEAEVDRTSSSRPICNGPVCDSKVSSALLCGFLSLFVLKGDPNVLIALWKNSRTCMSIVLILVLFVS